MGERKSYMDEQWEASWRFRWGVRWERLKDAAQYWLWRWPTDGLVWDFNVHPMGRLMHCRSRRFLDEHDPRHFGE